MSQGIKPVSNHLLRAALDEGRISAGNQRAALVEFTPALVSFNNHPLEAPETPPTPPRLDQKWYLDVSVLFHRPKSQEHTELVSVIAKRNFHPLQMCGFL